MIAFLLQKHTDHFDQGVWQDDDNNTYKSRTVHRSVVVAQLEEQLLPTPMGHGGGSVVSVFTFYSKDTSLNPTAANSVFCLMYN